MALDSISSATNPATSTIAKRTDDTGSTKSNLGLDEATFLKLLVTQLKNQDPTNPTDPSAWTQQVASLSQVEQQTNTNTKLDKLIGLQSGTAVSEQLASATNYIGKTAQTKGNTFVVPATGDIKFSYDVPAGTSNTVITILDSKGKAIGSFAGKTTQGKQNIVWDAADASGKRVPSGNYKLNVTTVDGNGKSGGATTYIYDKVMSVGIDGDKTNVVLDQGQIVAIGDILSIQ